MASLIWRTVLKMFTVSESKGGEEKVSRICFQVRKKEIQKKNFFYLENAKTGTNLRTRVEHYDQGEF